VPVFERQNDAFVIQEIKDRVERLLGTPPGRDQLARQRRLVELR
jgi:hypothetical protein